MRSPLPGGRIASRPVSEFIDPTLIVARFERPERGARFRDDLERAAAHYAPTSETKLEIRCWIAPHSAAAVIQGESEARWPAWAENPRLAIASAYVPLEWERVTGVPEPAEAALPLASALLADPERAARELAAPCVLALVDKAAETVTVVNDALGAGRLYEAGADGIRAWSNRLGALAIVSGAPLRADEDAWALFAAFGWFPRGHTPIHGTSPVSGASILELGPDRVTRRSGTALADSLEPGAGSLADATEAFAADAVARSRAVGRLYPEPPRIDLSGGRDSRVTAAAVVAAGVDARFRTSDLTPGEADVARDLIARLPGEVEHKVQWAGGKRKPPPASALARAAGVHMIHDGMRHAAKVRGKMTLPRRQPTVATVSGHGGAVAKGSLYSTKKLARIEADGDDAMMEILLRSIRRAHGAATDHAFALAGAQVRSDLDLGREYGLNGPSLLDWSYLIERFVSRTALAADVASFTFFSSPEFVRAAFLLEPHERLESKLHLDALRLLVPSWAEVAFFKPERARRGLLGRLLGRGEVKHSDAKRDPIWVGPAGAEIRELVARGGTWTGMFDPIRVEEILAEIDAGRPHPHFQDVLESIVYRSAFDDHLEKLASA